jgi:DHA1 family multidrug resistance protein-like MFS transporter/DHA1 family quinolone resistance protein-like MFS transporter
MKTTTSSILLFLYVSTFVISLSIGMSSPLVPLYAQQLGASYLDLGVIGVAWSVPYIILPAIIGALADRVGRRVFFLVGMAGCAHVSGLFLLAYEVWHVTMIRAFNGIAYSFMFPVVEALVVDITSSSERIRAMGRYSFSWAFGMLAGPFIGGLLLENFGFTVLFSMSLVVGISAFIIALYAMFFPYRPKSKPITTKITSSSKGTAPVYLYHIYLVIVMYSIAMSLIFSIFPAYAEGLGIDAFQIGTLLSTFGTARVLTFWYSESITRIGEKPSIILALVTQALSLIAIAYLYGFIPFLIFMALLGCSTGVLTPLSLSTASKMVSSAKVAITMGIVESFFGIG